MKSLGTNRSKMGNTVVFATLWCLGFGSKFATCTAWVNDLTRFIAETSEFKQVKILTRLDKDENFENPLSEELLVRLRQKIPTMLINFEDDFKLPVNSVPDNELGSKTPIDTSATLFLMLIESTNGLSTSTTERFLDTVAEMANYQYSPKYLIVSLVEKPSDNINALLEYAWSKKMLDLTIVELAEPKVPKTSILIERSVALPMIHRLNPFKNEYTAEKWTAVLKNFFPNKVSNMWGHSADYTLYNALGNFEAENLWFYNMMEQHFNLSWVTVDSLLWGWDQPSSKEHKQIDLGLELRPFSSESWDDSLRTAWIKLGATYFVVPVLPMSETAISADFFVAIALSIAVIFIFWIVTRRLGMTSYPWRPFNVGRVFFGVSINEQPRPTAERILFTSLLVIFAIYSSIIYGAITEVTLQKTGEVEFNTLEDLADSSLTFHGSQRDINRAFYAMRDLPRTSEDRFVDDPPFFCIQRMEDYKNVSCLMSKRSATSLIPMIRAESTVAVKVAKPCLATDYSSFQVGRRSPYRSSFDKFIMRLHNAGLIDKFFNEQERAEKELTDNMNTEEPEAEDPLYKQLIAISIVGYGLSTLVFLAEIIYHRIFNREKSKVRPLLPLVSSRKPAPKIKVNSRRMVAIPNDELRPRMISQIRNAIRVFKREELRVEGSSIHN